MHVDCNPPMLQILPALRIPVSVLPVLKIDVPQPLRVQDSQLLLPVSKSRQVPVIPKQLIPIPPSRLPMPRMRLGVPIQPRSNLPTYRDPILPVQQHKPPNMPLTPSYQSPCINNKPIDIDAIEPDLNITFEENASHQEGITYEVYNRTGKEYPQESPEVDKWIESKKIIQ